MFRNRVYEYISNVIGPICSGFVHFHLVEFVSQQLSSFFGLFKVVCLTNMFREFEVAQFNWNINSMQINPGVQRGLNGGPFVKNFTKQKLFH